MTILVATDSEHATGLRLLSVNVGLPEVIGLIRGEPVISGIKKRRVETPTLYLDRYNLAGDRQADLRVHGGLDKAVYAYPSEHLPFWNAELARQHPLEPGSFGENLTTAGLLEDDVLIGDIWTWGDALLQVSQPRYPCYKLTTVIGVPSIGKRFVAGGRTGWYLRVLKPGEVPVAGPITVVTANHPSVTVREAHVARLPPAPRDLIERVAALPSLATSLRGELLHRLESGA